MKTNLQSLFFRSKKKENSKINEDNAVTSSEAEDTDQDQNSDSNQ